MKNGKKVTAILLAGGSGSRFGAAGNKVYVKANGRPILQYSLDVLTESGLVDECILVVKDGEQELASSLNFHCPVKIVTGGTTRQESVYHGLAVTTGDLVLVHDSARPVILPAYVERCLAALEEFPGSAMAVRSKDTIKLTDERDVVTQTTVRQRTWIVQTPQCFRTPELKAAHERYKETPGITDDCMLLELAGGEVKLIEGDYTNIKVTTAEDLTLAEAFLKALGR